MKAIETGRLLKLARTLCAAMPMCAISAHAADVVIKIGIPRPARREMPDCRS